MPQDDNQHRYNDIRKRIANRKPFGQQPTEKQQESPYDIILDLINAYDTLATLPVQSYNTILCYGPQVIRRAQWSGVVIWYRNKGYLGYQKLYLLGVWAHRVETDIYVTLGIRELAYQAAVYNPEGYHASIRNNFKLYYEDDGHPPDDNDLQLFQTVYHQKERLTLRQTLQQQLSSWQKTVNLDDSSIDTL